jgi:hypothetical protein
MAGAESLDVAYGMVRHLHSHNSPRQSGRLSLNGRIASVFHRRQIQPLHRHAISGFTSIANLQENDEMRAIEHHVATAVT